jgi:hypothetical protein
MNMPLRHSLAYVTYQATLTDGREVDLRLAMPENEATVVDAWRRLSATFGSIDPFSLEVEVRSGLSERSSGRTPRTAAAARSCAQARRR